MRISGGLRPFNNSSLRIGAREATVFTWLTSAGNLGRLDIGQAFSATVSATVNNTSTVSYTLYSGTLPTGVVLNQTTGVLSGIPSSVGMYAFTIRASGGRITSDRIFSITTNPVTVVWSTAENLGSLNGGHAMTTTPLVATVTPVHPVTYTIVSGALPGGLTLSASGALSGTPANLTVNSTFTVRATYAGTVSADRTFTLNVVADAITWATPAGSIGSLLGGHVTNLSLDASCTAGDPISFSLVSGTLPSGLSLSGNKISGTTANLAGTSSFTIRAADGLTFLDRVFSISVAQDTITWANDPIDLGQFGGGATFSKTFSATSSNGETVTFALQSGTLPAGLTLYTGGLLSGAFTNVTGSFSFTIRASDGITFTDHSYTGSVVADAITWVSTGGALGVVNQNGTFMKSISATSSAGKTVTYAVVTGALPTGISLSNAGYLSGTSTDVPGTFAFTIRASDGVAFADLAFSLRINGAPVWSTSAGSIGTFNQMERFTYTFSAVDPDGIASYTIDQQIDETITFVSNSMSNTAVLSGYYVSQDPMRPVWQTPRGDLGTFNRQVAVSLTINAAPDPARTITSYSILGTNLIPAGLMMTRVGNAATITGNVDLYPAAQSEPEAPFTPSPVFTTPAGSLGAAVLGTTYTANVAATPMLGNAISRYEIIGGSGNLPFGVSLTQASGIITGTVDPTAALLDPPASLPAPVFTVPAGNLGTFNNTPGNNTTANVAVTATPTYGNAVVLYSVVGNASVLPPGLVVGANGRVTGTIDPAATAETPVILPGPVWSTPAGSLGAAKNGNAVTIGFSATPLANTTVNLVTLSGAYPAGTMLSTSNVTSGAFTVTGTLDGNATTTSTALAADRIFAFTLRALGSDGGYADRSFTYTISSN